MKKSILEKTSQTWEEAKKKKTMTKEDLQLELKEKVKEGIKPSDLKKLKRSKSVDDIAQIPSVPPLPNPPNHLLQDQLAEKQKLIEQLRKDLEEKNTALSEVKQELDNSLQARIAAVKVFGQEHDKRTKVEQELNETVEEASEELISTDKQVSNLRSKLRDSQQEISKLKQDLNKARLKRTILPYPDPAPSLDYLKYALYSLLAVWFVLLLINNSQKLNNHA